MATASFKTLSPNKSAYNVTSTAKSLNIASTVTGIKTFVVVPREVLQPQTNNTKSTFKPTFTDCWISSGGMFPVNVYQHPPSLFFLSCVVITHWCIHTPSSKASGKAIKQSHRWKLWGFFHNTLETYFWRFPSDSFFLDSWDGQRTSPHMKVFCSRSQGLNALTQSNGLNLMKFCCPQERLFLDFPPKPTAEDCLHRGGSGKAVCRFRRHTRHCLRNAESKTCLGFLLSLTWICSWNNGPEQQTICEAELQIGHESGQSKKYCPEKRCRPQLLTSWHRQQQQMQRKNCSKMFTTSFRPI